MTDNEQRIFIAKICGWRWYRTKYIGQSAMLQAYSGRLKFLSPKQAENTRDWINEPSEEEGELTIVDIQQLPDYLNNLEVMREAEFHLHKLTETNEPIPEYPRIYLQKLNEVVCGDADEVPNWDWETIWDMVRATARQRAEAFIHTIQGTTP